MGSEQAFGTDEDTVAGVREGVPSAGGPDGGWERAARLLDGNFPLASGSHATVVDYLLHFDQLLAIHADGTCTGLARSGQLVEAGGDPAAPRSIRLEHEGLEAEIEPCNRPARAAGRCREHRLRLLTAVAAA